ncbi:MAG TPA: type II secretion system major pseudopilin GspG [Steroidobacteraceae bacterium]|nr:type II secretion system major pseudopilin GspG [Steroidobacteraceae bacterium]
MRKFLAVHRSPGRDAGFTLIEIMVVVIIIGLLAAVIVPQVVGRVEDARIAKTRQDIQAMSTALTLYRLDNFKYPTTDQGLRALVQQPADPTIKNWKQGGYLQQGFSLKDPWGNDYQYVNPGTHGGEYDLFSYGADGQEGGEGNNADIGNWNLDANTNSNANNGSR